MYAAFEAAPDGIQDTSLRVVDGRAIFRRRVPASGSDPGREELVAAPRRGPVQVVASASATAVPGAVQFDLARAFAIGDRLVVPDASGGLIATAGTPATTDTLLPPDFFFEGVLGRLADGRYLVRITTAGSPPSSRQVWIVDGRVEGTARLRTADDRVLDRAVTAGDGFAGQATFATFDGATLWRTDGTPEGTVAIQEAGATNQIVTTPSRLLHVWTEFGGFAYERLASMSPDGATVQLFQVSSDSFNQSAIIPVKPPGGRFPSETAYFLRAFQDEDFERTLTLFAVEDTAESARAVFELQGTSLPTVIIDDVPLLGERLFFSVGDRLWTSDGTAEGTREIVPPATEPPLRDPQLTDAVAVEGRLLFAAQGWLWATDGSAAGTRVLAPRAALPDVGAAAVIDGTLLFTAEDGLGAARLWRSDGTPEGTMPVSFDALGQVPTRPAELTVADGRLFFAADTDVGRELVAIARADVTVPRLALRPDERFEVTVTWRKPDGSEGVGTPERLTADTGVFWFFREENLELMIKVLDGRGNNGHFWVFYGALSNVEYGITVVDTETGAFKSYANPPGRFASVGDTRAFPAPGGSAAADDGALLREAVDGLARLTESDAGDLPEGRSDLGCRNLRDVMCLQGFRFLVEAEWEKPDGETGVGTPTNLTLDTGTFWFFREENVELMVKVLDGRNNNGHFWVFYGALSNVRYTLTVTDLFTGARRTYENPQGDFASVGDTRAFADP